MNWTELFSGTVMGALITQVGRITRVAILTRRSTRKYFMDTSQLYEILTGTLSNSPMDRWTVFIVHNGGQKLNVLTESYMSILWEDFDKGQKPRKTYYQKFPLDKSFHNLFKDAYMNGSAMVDIALVDEMTVVHSAMEVLQIRHEQYFFQVETKKAIYFLAFGSTIKRYDDLTPGDKALIQLSVERARGLLMSNAKYL